MGLIFTKKKFNAISPETCKTAIASHSSHKFHPVEFLGAPYNAMPLPLSQAIMFPLKASGDLLFMFTNVCQDPLFMFTVVCEDPMHGSSGHSASQQVINSVHTPMCVILYIYIGIIVGNICFPSTRP